MNDLPKSNENNFSGSIDIIIDDAIENAEDRRELSDNELDDVNGGLIIRIGGYLLGWGKENQ
jgi:hypothetical protein